MKYWLKFLLIAGSLSVFFAVLHEFGAEATVRYTRDTGKRCFFCHTGIPEPGDEDPQLNEDGKKFVENDYKLTEEQKRRPD